MAGRTENFGEYVRRLREEKKLGLREMAKMIGVSPTYLSRVERNEDVVPVEERVRKIATILACDADELLAKAGRVSTDLSDIIKQQPLAVAAFLRTANGMSPADWTRFTKRAKGVKGK